MDLKRALADLGEKLAELENAARKLENQNFADIIKSAGGKLAQASEHPDLEAVEKHLRGDLEQREGAQFPFQDPSQQGSG